MELGNYFKSFLIIVVPAMAGLVTIADFYERKTSKETAKIQQPIHVTVTTPELTPKPVYTHNPSPRTSDLDTSPSPSRLSKPKDSKKKTENINKSIEKKPIPNVTEQLPITAPQSTQTPIYNRHSLPVAGGGPF